jgi:aspartyl aminopeptidase
MSTKQALKRKSKMQTTINTTINELDKDGHAELLAQEFKMEAKGGKLFEIPAAYQGEEFRHAKELTKGMQVIDSHYGSPRVCTVLKTYKMSVKLSYTYPNGMVSEYGCPIHHLRRLA